MITIIALLLVTPMVGAIAVAVLSRPPGLRDVLHIGFALATALVAGSLLLRVGVHQAGRLTLAHPLPGVELAFAADPLGAIFAAIVAGLGLLQAVYTVGFVRSADFRRPAQLMAFISLSAGATIAACLSANLFTLFVCYQALILVAAPLIRDRDADQQRRAVRLYLVTNMGVSTGLFLPAVVWTYAIAGTVEFQAGGVLAGLVDSSSAGALLFLFAVGASMCVLPPLSSWIGASTGSAWPALVSIQFVALAPAGAISLLKIAAYVLGAGLSEARLAANILLAVSGLGACLCAAMAISKQDMRERLAYSGTAQMLCAVLGVLLAVVAGPAGLFASALQIASTCFAGATLCMACGAVAIVTGRTNAPDFVGLGRVMPWTFAGFAVASASMIGMPPFAGAWAKLWLITAAAGSGLVWAAGLIGIVAVLTFAHLGPLAANALAGRLPDGALKRPDGASFLLVGPIVIGAAATLSLLVLADPLASFLAPVWTHAP